MAGVKEKRKIIFSIVRSFFLIIVAKYKKIHIKIASNMKKFKHIVSVNGKYLYTDFGSTYKKESIFQQSLRPFVLSILKLVHFCSFLHLHCQIFFRANL